MVLICLTRGRYNIDLNRNTNWQKYERKMKTAKMNPAKLKTRLEERHGMFCFRLSLGKTYRNGKN